MCAYVCICMCINVGVAGADEDDATGECGGVSPPAMVSQTVKNTLARPSTTPFALSVLQTCNLQQLRWCNDRRLNRILGILSKYRPSRGCRCSSRAPGLRSRPTQQLSATSRLGGNSKGFPQNIRDLFRIIVPRTPSHLSLRRSRLREPQQRLTGCLRSRASQYCNPYPHPLHSTRRLTNTRIQHLHN